MDADIVDMFEGDGDTVGHAQRSPRLSKSRKTRQSNALKMGGRWNSAYRGKGKAGGLILFLALQRFYIRGLMAGAVK
ncbi:hypothetical protein ACWGTI_32035 [Mesorhizobium sp. ArgA1]